ncbi:MAG: Glyoxalase-like domain [Chloroflexi bacterium]|nr:Glyoxalase-like domain [Chloroflexota bacterium]
MNVQLPNFQQLLQHPNRRANKKPHINPRFRAYGRARIDIIQRVQDQQDWDRLWKSPANAFPFIWTKGWTHCIEYCVNDYAAEVGFYTDFLGLPVDEFGPQYARFTSPWGDFYIGVVAGDKERTSTPINAFRLQFQISDLMDTFDELSRRGIEFEQPPKLDRRNTSLATAILRTPHGIAIDLVGAADYKELDISPPSVPNADQGPDHQEELRDEEI